MFGKSVPPALNVARRFGFAAKGIVYLLVGYLAARTAVKGGGPAPDEQTALHQVLAAPLGRVLLSITAAGLLIYALWRLIEMWSDPEKKGAMWRVQSFLSALAYGSLAVEAFRTVLGMGSGGSGESEAKEQAALLIALPLGHWLTIAIALLGIVFGLQDVWRAIAPDFEDRYAIKELSRRAKSWVLRIGRAGILARGAVSTIVGTYLLVAGMRRSPSAAKGTSGAIESLGQFAFGRWILVLIALGLAAYGVYTLAESRYRRLKA
jgi:hypothetical protein